MAYLWNLLIALDQLTNTILLGDPDETLSSRMGKEIKANRCLLCRGLCRLIGHFDRNHCAKTIEPDEGRNAILQGPTDDRPYTHRH